MTAPINPLSIKPMYLPPLPPFSQKKYKPPKIRINYEKQKSKDK